MRIPCEERPALWVQFRLAQILELHLVRSLISQLAQSDSLPRIEPSSCADSMLVAVRESSDRVNHFWVTPSEVLSTRSPDACLNKEKIERCVYAPG